MSHMVHLEHGASPQRVDDAEMDMLYRIAEYEDRSIASVLRIAVREYYKKREAELPSKIKLLKFKKRERKN